MTTGHFIRIGDKTTCGGTVLSGSPHHRFGGIATARNGDKVSYGKDGKTYRIAGGMPHYSIHGIAAAGTLHSRSTCPCRARLISSYPNASYWAEEEKQVKATATPLAEAPAPEQHAQTARKPTAPAAGETHSSPPKTKKDITLTLGVFFDGTGNNAINTDNMIKACIAERYGLDDTDAGIILGKCAQERMGVSGTGATSYLGYYTNVHWLRTLYKKSFTVDDSFFQRDIYIEGIGTEAGKPDSLLGQGLGISDTGVIAKTDKAVSSLTGNIQVALDELSRTFPNNELVIKSLQFDIFGFSRGAAASRHFANRIHSEDPAIIAAIRDGMQGTLFNGAPAGHIRFIGLFDTVAAIGTPLNGLNPHNADTGNVNLVLRPGVADKVFHITAAHECRFNFALNSVKPAWPELALPGVHSDIGGGYLPAVEENLFLTRPETDTVPPAPARRANPRLPSDNPTAGKAGHLSGGGPHYADQRNIRRNLV